MNNPIKNEAIVKGEALAKLIELVGSGQKALESKDAELTALVDEVREMFKSDEQTVVTHTELLGLVATSELEPGHKYYVLDDDAYITAASTNTFEPFAIYDQKLVQVDNELNYTEISFDSNYEAISSEDIQAMFDGTYVPSGESSSKEISGNDIRAMFES